MLYAVKDNKSYQVGEDKKQQADFLARGYDIVNDRGRTVQHSPVKTVLYTQYAAVLDENMALKTQLAAVQNGKK